MNKTDFAARLGHLDLSLFAAVTSSASAGDRRTLLAVHREARRPGYAYAEIGSERGGSLQAHVADPWCARVFSIDLRVTEVDDTRGRKAWYADNTTAAMRAELERAMPGSTAKLTTFDAAARDVPTASLQPRPSLVFIDAEHTDRAAEEDFRWALEAVEPDGWIVFHDATLVPGAIGRALRELRRTRREHAGAWVVDDVFAIALGAESAARLARLPGPARGVWRLRAEAAALRWERWRQALPERLVRWRRKRFPRLAFWRPRTKRRF